MVQHAGYMQGIPCCVVVSRVRGVTLDFLAQYSPGWPPTAGRFSNDVGGLLQHLAICLLATGSSPCLQYRTEWRKSEPHMRKEMSLIAAHAAWHMGEWEEMAIYVDTVDSGPGGSNNPAHLVAAASLALQHQQQHPMVGSTSTNALNAAAAALSSNSSSSSRTSSGGFRLLGGPAAAAAAGGGASSGGGGAASSTGAFLRAVLCIKHDQHDLAQVNIERSRGTWLYIQGVTLADRGNLAFLVCLCLVEGCEVCSKRSIHHRLALLSSNDGLGAVTTSGG